MVTVLLVSSFREEPRSLGQGQVRELIPTLSYVLSQIHDITRHPRSSDFVVIFQTSLKVFKRRGKVSLFNCS
jgi:hypothetical protein